MTDAICVLPVRWAVGWVAGFAALWAEWRDECWRRYPTCSFYSGSDPDPQPTTPYQDATLLLPDVGNDRGRY
jgi:hypothetical protein